MLGSWDSNQKINEERIYGYIYIYRERERERACYRRGGFIMEHNSILWTTSSILFF